MAEELTVRQEQQSEALREERSRRMQEMEDALLSTSDQIIDAHLAFQELSPGATEPPAAWVEQYGAEGARLRFQVAMSGWGSVKDRPSGVALAMEYKKGMTRARAYREQARQIYLNAKIVLPPPTSPELPGAPEYPELEID